MESTTNKLRVNGEVVEEAELGDGDTVQVRLLEGKMSFKQFVLVQGIDAISQYAPTPQCL